MRLMQREQQIGDHDSLTEPKHRNQPQKAASLIRIAIMKKLTCNTKTIQCLRTCTARNMQILESEQ